ncbi:MAG: EthD family reductase [Achromobacter sp.]|uniref:EthD family reductase n=1 Tax=Achromobacter sp. TaxID=134375 RepID=UPI0012C5D1EC|nr:EthD family reductase [Achromobacter sp.]MPS79698.1 EthD family reductase [Achromobacter sp.]
MQKLMVLYPMPRSPEEFRQYYLTNHLPLAAQLPGLKSSRYSLAVEGLGEEAPYFCVWEGEFDSSADLDAALSSEIGQRVAADIPNYATRGAILIRCTPVESTQ